MLRYWIGHYKSLILFIVVALALGLGYHFYQVSCIQPTEDEVITEDVQVEIPLVSEDAADYSIHEKITVIQNYMTDLERSKVEETVNLHDDFQSAQASYKAEENKLSAADASNILYNLSYSSSIISTNRAAFTAVQNAYFDLLTGKNVDINALTTTTTTTVTTTVTETVLTTTVMKSLVLAFCIAIVLHFILFCCIYICSDKIKRTDCLANFIDAPELSRISLDTQLPVVATALVDILNKNNLSSVCLISTDMVEKLEKLSADIAAVDSELSISIINSLPGTTEEMITFCRLQNAILVVGVWHTHFSALRKLLELLRLHGVNVLGYITYECPVNE